MVSFSDLFVAASRASARDSALAFGLLGIFFNIAIQGVEFELYMYHFMAISISLYWGLIFTVYSVADYGILTAFARVSLLYASFGFSLMTSMVCYRLFFHRLCRFPGPVWAKITRFHASSLAAKNIQYYKELAKLHAQYGDFVRTGPREISILRPEAADVIYGPQSECRKSTWYGGSSNDPNKCSVNMTRDFAQHRLRRRAWDRAFSMKALSTYQPRVKAKADLLIDQLRKRSDRPIDITTWAMFFGFDVMGDLGFSKEFYNLESGVEHHAIKAIHKHMTTMAVVSMTPWLLNILGSIPGAAAAFSGFFDFCGSEIKAKQKSWDGEQYPRDITSWLLKAVKENDPSASPSQESLDDDSRVVIIAGSDTSATVLANTMYFLAKHPDKQRKVQTLLDRAMPGGYTAWSYDKVKTVTYVDDIINETLRLRPPVVMAMPRETPAKGIRVGDVHIPGGANVLMPLHQLQRDKRWWQQGEDWIPERWGERRHEMGTDGAPWLPFSLGAFGCSGKNLGYLNMRTSISSIVMNFDVAFVEGEDDEAFYDGALDTLTMTLPPLKLKFTARGSVDGRD
ncbi:cytochrome P450 [Lophiotrema nucula]|uniref:Cytochrome P450 n=1 Tax=Lophiotrema nucula TaxID=690887 RepID=A0A6A5YJG0_9PLEO|nr:cytochrome P450 [Lophiotrema nucula]